MTTKPDPFQCATTGCTELGITAIRTTAPRGKSLVHTIWQDANDAPKTALRYCGPHGVALAASLTSLTDGDLRVETLVTTR